jgi:hypothetical protein
MTRSADPRAQDLLADRALYGLDAAEAGELHGLGAADDDSFDLAAAAIDLATLPIEPMPVDLAERMIAAHHPGRLTGGPTPTRAAPAAIPPVAPRPRRRRPLVSGLAAVATLLIVAGAWWLIRGRAAPPPTAAQARAELLADAGDATRLDWHATPEGGGASGDVVWSPSAQRGYLRFVGLAPNDPAKTQYQLWIFDRQRDQAFPVDGGVFDVSSTGEVIVPITAKLRVADATLFAVTVERPGGVVVSRRDHIVVTAGRS